MPRGVPATAVVPMSTVPDVALFATESGSIQTCAHSVAPGALNLTKTQAASQLSTPS